MEAVINFFKNLFKPGCDHRFDMDTIRDCNFEPKCNKCGKYVSGIVGHKKYHTHQYHFELVSDDQYKIRIK